MPINRGTDKPVAANAFYAMPLKQKGIWFWHTHDSVGKSQRHYTQWKKPEEWGWKIRGGVGCKKIVMNRVQVGRDIGETRRNECW